MSKRVEVVIHMSRSFCARIVDASLYRCSFHSCHGYRRQYLHRLSQLWWTSRRTGVSASRRGRKVEMTVEMAAAGSFCIRSSLLDLCNMPSAAASHKSTSSCFLKPESQALISHTPRIKPEQFTTAYLQIFEPLMFSR